ncbi:MAG TPA: phosphoribosylformylglycinamidine synthase subunit PurS [Bacillota bacterium]|nr:phosphoribosylformylglycinamidine synthase subunit PurS [Bacillota bacterium]HOH09812.1 phosphoribosylformylglycinamidine synthase subunit PurS [Bacillota bacterium]HOY89535.1 phosphoribosylformylglycinamidine synthase subunit PurS [Bacillota bacterium]HPI00775.1 phosphoribosylformylglycinamidine synthase subunit PurS [Bacillota bacterium]HPM63958.1 phosphoribosylformylglycinamidine synthase subunit PurS [Bacillota bacterium]
MKSYLAKVVVTLKPSILDPQGVAVRTGLLSMGYSDVDSVRLGKFIEVRLKADDEAAARAMVDEISKKLLANLVMERYEFTVAEEVAK